MLEVRSAKILSWLRTGARTACGLLILSGGIPVLAGCAGTVRTVQPAQASGDERPEPPAFTSATQTAPLSLTTTTLPAITSAEEGFTSALEAFQGGNAEAAGQYAQRVIRDHPDTPWRRRSLFLLGRTYLARDMTADAESVLLRMPAEYPDLADYAFFELAEHYAARLRWDDAVGMYGRLIDSYPSSPLEARAQLRRAQVLLDAGRGAEAATAFEALLQEQPWCEEAPDAALGLGKARTDAGDLAGAVRAYRDVTVKYPSPERDQAAANALAVLRTRGAAVPDPTPDEWYERGTALFRASQFEPAYDAFRKALEAGPDHPQKADMLLRSGIALYRLGRRPEAASVLERLLKAKLPDCRCAEALNWLGKSYSRLGLREEAVETYLKLVSLYPDSGWADNALYLAGNVYRDAGDMRQALKYYRRLVAEYPGSSLADSSLWWDGWASYSAGDYRAAEQVFREIVKRYPRSFLVNQALYWQGRAAEQRGSTEQALRSWQRVLKRGPFTYYGYRTAERFPGSVMPVEYEAVVAADGSGEDGAPGEELEPDGSEQEDGPPDWTDDAFAALSASPAYHRTMELMYLGMKKEAAAELWSLQELMPRRQGALMGLSKTFFKLGDYHRSLIIVLRNYERALERPSPRYSDDLWVLAYPQGYWTSIITQARKYGLDPFFVAAVIREESQFRPDAVSPAGARGVMQVMPATGAWIARNAGIADFDRSRLHDPDLNITVGSWYLNHLMKRFKGDIVLVSAAYNAGPEAVASWVDKKSAADRDAAVFVETIPFVETRGYVKKVLRNYAEYRRIYGGPGLAALPGAPAGSGAAAGTAKGERLCRAGDCP